MPINSRVQPLTALHPDAVRHVSVHLPYAVKEMLAAYPQLFVAGGFIRAVLAREAAKDIDIFTSDLSIVGEAVQFYVLNAPWTESPPVVKIRKTPCTTTVEGGEYPLQFIDNTAYTPETLIRSVDFTVCQAAVWRDARGAWKSLHTEEFIRDVVDRRLVYASPVRKEAPGGSLWRATKFLQRGYSITQAELAALVARLVNGQDAMRDKRLEDDDDTGAESVTQKWSADAILRSFSFRGKGLGGIY